MTLVYLLFAIYSVTFNPGVTLEEAVAQTPELAGGPYFYTVQVAGRGYTTALYVTHDNWQQYYDAVWQEADQTLPLFGVDMSQKLPYERGCWESHTCPPVYITKAGHESESVARFFSFLLRYLSPRL